MSRITIAAALSSAVLLVSACGGAGDDDGEGGTSAGGTLRIALDTFGSEQLDPVMESGSVLTNLLLPMYDTLLDIDENGDIAPGLATGWERAEDGVTWTFTLREGVQFHDGWGEVTAEDVKFSMERWSNEAGVAAETAVMRQKVARVEVVDRYTVQVVTNGPQIDLLYLFSPHENGSGIVFSRKHLTETAGDDFAAQTRALNEHPIGSGPFRFVSRERGASLVYEAVDEHWRRVPAVKRVEFLLVTEPATQIAMLRNGEVDIISVSGDGAREVRDAGLEVRSIPNTQDISVQFTGVYRPPAQGKPTTDPRVRHALSLAIDRETILATILDGQGSLPETPFDTVPSTADVDEEHFADWAEEVRRYDPEAAEALLAEAGYPDGFSGIKMYTYTRPGAPFTPKIGEVVAADWAKIGVDVEIVSTDYGNYRPHYVNADINDDYNAGDATVYNIDVRFQALGVLDTYFNYSGGSVQLLNDPELDEAIGEIAATTDDAKRRELVSAVFDTINEQWVVLPLFTTNALYGVNPETVGEWEVFDGWPFFGRMLETIK